jgi:hypothetical protein
MSGESRATRCHSSATGQSAPLIRSVGVLAYSTIPDAATTIRYDKQPIPWPISSSGMARLQRRRAKCPPSGQMGTGSLLGFDRNVYSCFAEANRKIRQ